MNQVFNVVKDVIAHKTGAEHEDISPESFFKEDLNIDEMELGEIITDVEEELDLELDIELSEIKTVGDLLHAIQETVE